MARTGLRKQIQAAYRAIGHERAAIRRALTYDRNGYNKLAEERGWTDRWAPFGDDAYELSRMREEFESIAVAATRAIAAIDARVHDIESGK